MVTDNALIESYVSLAGAGLVAGGHACALPAAAELSLQSAAAILKIRNETTAIQEEGASAVASFTGITFAWGAAGQHPQRHHTARPPREVVSNLLLSDCSAAHHPGGTRTTPSLP